jgi:hypothetical protein
VSTLIDRFPLKGKTDKERPRVRITLSLTQPSPSAGVVEIPAIVDTGFDGGVVLPAELRSQLRFVYMSGLETLIPFGGRDPITVQRYSTLLRVVNDGAYSEDIPSDQVYFLRTRTALVGMHFLLGWLLTLDGPDKCFWMSLCPTPRKAITIWRRVGHSLAHIIHP